MAENTVYMLRYCDHNSDLNCRVHGTTGEMWIMLQVWKNKIQTFFSQLSSQHGLRGFEINLSIN